MVPRIALCLSIWLNNQLWQRLCSSADGQSASLAGENRPDIRARCVMGQVLASSEWDGTGSHDSRNPFIHCKRAFVSFWNLPRAFPHCFSCCVLFFLSLFKLTAPQVCACVRSQSKAYCHWSQTRKEEYRGTLFYMVANDTDSGQWLNYTGLENVILFFFFKQPY